MTVWEADDLTDSDGSALARGSAATCEIWVRSNLAYDIEESDSLEVLLDSAQTVTHEVGHAYGLGHTARGVMSDNGAQPKRPFGWAPAFSWGWARSNLRMILRGNGMSEREVRREVSEQMWLARR